MTKNKNHRRFLFTLMIIVTAIYAFSNANAQNNKNTADGKSLIGVWEDGETHNLITIEKVDGVPAVVSVIDQDDLSNAEIVSNNFKDGILEFKYHVPSTGYNLTMRTITLTDKGLNYHWDNGNNSGDDTFKRMMDIVAADKSSDNKVKKGKLLGKIYKITNDEIIVAVANTSSSLKIGDKLFVIVDDKKIGMNVSFPMMTISRCKISGADKKYKDKIKLNAQVYK